MGHDLGLIIAIVGSSVAIVGVVIAMMFWSRSEANTLRTEMKEDRKDFIQISRNIELTVKAMQDDMREFHRELIVIKNKVG